MSILLKLIYFIDIVVHIKANNMNIYIYAYIYDFIGGRNLVVNLMNT